MSKTNPNIGLFVECEVFGVKSNAALCNTKSGIIAAGELNPQNISLGTFVNEAVPIKSLYRNEESAVLKENNGFTANFAIIGKDKIAVLAKSNGLALFIIKNKTDWQIAFALNKEKLRKGAGFEQKIAEVAQWAGISNMNIIVQSAWQNKDTQLSKLLSADNLFIDVPKNFQSNLFIAGAKFNLNENGFGKALKTLTNINELDLWVGANPKDKSFGISLIAPRIETNLCIIENLCFALNKEQSNFICLASATFTLKLDGKNIKFALGGSASNTSFMLTGNSFPDTKIYITKRLFLSDLSLSIGVSSGVAFGMTGRISTDKLSIFVGFMISVPPPKINLLTFAMTSTNAGGRLSLADIVSDVADIELESVKFLDVIAVQDFDLQTNNTVSVNSDNFVNDFNSAVGKDFSISGDDFKKTELGQNQYIVTDNKNLRHFRIDKNGKISLNCQVYICSIATKIGTYNLNPGFFACGVLEVFGVKARFLFKIEKEKSLIALVQISPIKIANGIIELTGSKKKFPIAPIDGGLAGNLVPKPDQNKNPLTLYINIQKNGSSETCDLYFSAYLNILNILKADALVIMRDRMIFIDVGMSMWGFSLTVKLAANYGEVQSARFAFKIIFDTSGFLEMVKNAQEKLRNAAKQIENSTRAAQNKLTDAQNSVLRLENEIRNCDNNIASCKNALKSSKWYQFWIKIAKAAEIVWWNAKKAGIYVAIGVAYAALEAAKAIVYAGGKIASGVLQAAAAVIGFATQLLWVKSFELGVNVTEKGASIETKLVLIVLGKEKTIQGSLGNLQDPKDLVQGNINNESKGIEDKINRGEKISKTRAALSENIPIENILDESILKECEDLDKNYSEYQKSIEFTDAVDKFFISAGINHIDAYGEEDPNLREVAGNLSNMRMEYEMNAHQNEELFNEDFSKNMGIVLDELKRRNAPNKNVRSGLNKSRVNASPDKSDMLRNYLKNGIERNKSEQNDSLKSKPAEKKNLIGAYFDEVESTKSKKQTNKSRINKSRTNKMDSSSQKSNEKYADFLLSSLEEHFGHLDKDNPMNLASNEDFLSAISDLKDPERLNRK